MSRLREVVKDYEDELRGGIAWVVFWRDGRAWGSQYLYLDVGTADTIDPDDLWRLEQIQSTDPHAVALNGYYCGRLGEDMNTAQLTVGVRWHYENGYNTLAEFMEAHTAVMPPELIEEARQIAHAAGLPFSEKPYRGEEFDPYSYDGSMSPEDYELMHTLIAKERSEQMNDNKKQEYPYEGSLTFYVAESMEFTSLGAYQENLTLPEAVAAYVNIDENRTRGIKGIGFRLDDDSIYNDMDYPLVQGGKLDLDSLSLVNHFKESPLVRAAVADLITAIPTLEIVDNENYLRPTERSEQRNEYTHLEAFVSNLGTYTGGRPTGEWVSFPTDTEQMKAVFARIGIDGKRYEEWHITEYKSDIPGLASCLPEYGNMDELNYLGKLLSMQSPDDQRTFAAAVAHGEYNGSVKDLINLAQNLDCFWTYPVHDEEAYGRYLIDEIDTLELPEEAKKYFDYEAYGRDCSINEGGVFTQQGYVYNNQNTFSQWYDGQDVPREYRVTPGFSQPTRPDPEKADMDAISTRQTATLTAEPPQPTPVIPIILNAEKPGEKLKEITDRLEQGIKEVFESDRYKEYLSVMSKFHNYSFNNTLLIAMQKPDASRIAGFNSWKSEFERNVKKGEKGIKIIAPTPYKVKKELEKIDPSTQRPVMGKDGKPVTEEQEITIPAFKVVSVFDVSQTEGKELPDIGVDVLTGDVDRYKEFFAALEKTAPVPVGFEEMESGTQGYYHLEDKRIALKEDASQLQTLKTLIHEIAHAKLHDIDLKAPKEERADRPDRRTREVEAESIAYTVCQHYGLDTSDYSFGYVAGWSSGRELAELKSSLETIRSTANELINTIDGHIAEMQKEQTAELEQAPTLEPTTQENDNTFSIYQLKGGDETRDFRFEPYERLQAAGITLDAANYEQTYTAPLENGMSLDKIFETFNLDRPADFTGHSLSVSDVVVLHQDGQDTAHYVDSFGFQEVPGFLQPVPTLATEQAPEAPKQEAAETAVTYYPINETAARRAKEANSYSDYKPGSATAEYRSYVDEAVQIAERQKSRVDPMYHEKIDSLLDTYARKLAENMNSGYSIESRVPSIMIAGGSNFPVRQKEKQNNARDKNMHDWQDIKGLLEKIRSTGMGGISADDPNAVVKLESKLADLEKSQETMKAVNAYFRKNNTLDGCPHLAPQQLEKLKESYARHYPMHKKPFPTYALTNNSAEIRRTKARIEELKHREETPLTGWAFDSGTVEVNKEDNRLQVFFEEKPDEDKRTELKKGGFKWSPTAGAWQRQLNGNAFYAANYISCIQPLTGERPTDLQRAHIRAEKAKEQAEQQPPITEPDNFLTGEAVQTPRGSFRLTSMSKQEMEAAGYGFHHQSDDGKYFIMGNGTRAFAIQNEAFREQIATAPTQENPLATAEISTEQNYNMIDGVINNTPTVGELEAKVNAGEQISLTDLAAAIKADKQRGDAPKEKPSIRAQLKESKEKAATKKATKTKNQDLEV